METLELTDPDESGLMTLMLNRPGQLNSLDGTMVRELDQALTEVANHADVRVLRIVGAGRGFMAGGDLRWFAGMFADCPDPEQRRRLEEEGVLFDTFGRVNLAVFRWPGPDGSWWIEKGMEPPLLMPAPWNN